MALAYSYIRFSTKKQAQGDSLRRQTEQARDYARKHGLTLDENLSYQDLGISAFDGSNAERGQFAAFMQAVRDGKVPAGSYLLVEQFDRLSRVPPLDALMQLQSLVSAGITVVTLDDEQIYNQETTRDPAALFLSIATMYRAYNESASKSTRLLSVWQAKRDRKEAVLTKECPRWLRAKEDRSGFELIPEKSESVRRVFELTIAGYGNVALARRANAERWTHPGDAKEWNQTIITKIISNRATIGEYQPKIYRKGKRIPQGEPWKDYFPRVVSDEIFTLANAAKAQRAKVPGRRDKHYKNLFQGILKCGCCGASYVRKNKHSTKQPNYSLYMCSRRVNGATKCTSINGQLLEINLLTNIYLEGYSHIRTDEEAEAFQAKLVLLQAEKVETETTIARYVRAIAATDSPAVYESLAVAEKHLAEIAKDLNSTKASLNELRLAERNVGTMMQTTFTEDYNRIQDETEIEFRAQLREKILSIVKKIIVFPERHAAVVYYKHIETPFIQPLDSIEFEESSVPELIDKASIFVNDSKS